MPGTREEQLEVTSAESAAGDGWCWPLVLVSVEVEEALVTLATGAAAGCTFCPSWVALVADSVPSSGGDLVVTDEAAISTMSAGNNQRKRKQIWKNEKQKEK